MSNEIESMCGYILADYLPDVRRDCQFDLLGLWPWQFIKRRILKTKLRHFTDIETAALDRDIPTLKMFFPGAPPLQDVIKGVHKRKRARKK